MKIISIALIEIRPITEADIPLLEKRFPEGGMVKHAERFSRQQKGEAIYLLAWYQGQPVGHLLLKWGGSQDEPITAQLRVMCPDIEDLFVMEEFRSQGIGGQLLSYAEQLVRERGYTHIGLSVAAENNNSAHRLYERLGYRDSHLGEYTERGGYFDGQRKNHTWEEVCIYLIKDLTIKNAG